MRRKLQLSLLIAVVSAVLMAGCGGGSGNSDSSSAEPVTTSSLTKAEYIKEANAVCTRGREAREAESESYTQDNPDKSEKELIDVVTHEIYVPGKEADLAELRELGAPAGDEKQIEAIIAAFEKAMSMLSQLKGSGNTPAFNKQANQAGLLARKYKLIECTYG